jgi:plastocyanin
MPLEVTMTPTSHRALGATSAAAGLAGLVLAACGGGAQPAAAATAQPAAAAAAPTPTAAAPANPVATTSVDIANFAFSPAVITVRAGATVTWANRDEDAHTVAITGAAVSKPLQNGDTYAHTFAQPGRYAYICTIHPSMRGMVVVTAG